MKVFIVTAIATILITSSGALAGGPEKLIGLSTDFSKETLTITVASSGCTEKEDFSIKNENGTVTFIRKNRDDCKAMPHRIDIQFSLKELGIDKHRPFNVSNEFIVNENVAMY